jgi:hypothetical protein
MRPSSATGGSPMFWTIFSALIIAVCTVATIAKARATARSSEQIDDVGADEHDYSL